MVSVKNNQGCIPIQQECWYKGSFDYVGLVLAREGIKYNVGGEGKRGDLLLEHPTDDYNRNILQVLSNI